MYDLPLRNLQAGDEHIQTQNNARQIRSFRTKKISQTRTRTKVFHDIVCTVQKTSGTVVVFVSHHQSSDAPEEPLVNLHATITPSRTFDTVQRVCTQYMGY